MTQINADEIRNEIAKRKHYLAGLKSSLENLESERYYHDEDTYIEEGLDIEISDLRSDISEQEDKIKELLKKLGSV